MKIFTKGKLNSIKVILTGFRKRLTIRSLEFSVDWGLMKNHDPYYNLFF